MLGVSASQIGHNNNNNNNTITSSSVRGGADGAEAQESGGTSGGSCGEVGGATTPAGMIFMSEEAEKSGGGGGNRWPRQETLALLKIRSDMDLTFRDSSLKGPLWDEVSRKMAELGYHRNPKKCKEKFENVYKYHKRTKEGRSTKSDGKTYRFFDQLQALENIGGAPPPQQPPPPPSVQLPPPPRPSPQTMAAAVTMAVPIQVVQPAPTPPQVPSHHQHQLTVSSAPQNTTISFNSPFASSFPQPSQSPHPPPQPPTVVAGNTVVPPSFFSSSPSLSSSSTSSDEEPARRDNRKRKYKDLFQSLMQNVVEKQEAMQKKFLETLEKRERDRITREEAWRNQEMARLKNEHDLLVQERSMAAERESALISLLQKLTENQQNQKQPNNQTALPFGAVQIPEKPVPRTPTPTPPPSAPPPPPPPHVPEPAVTTTPVMAPQFMRAMENSPKQENNNNNSGGLEAYTSSSATSSRWPKAEIDALINLRTHLDNKYQENGPKGPLWEEISSEMKKLGYSRNAKRCKEKWENINKYYKKVKESNKKRPEDSKTCPYFHQLDALYREKEKSGKPENSMMPIMARPEQQWPFPQQEHQQQNQLQLQQQQQAVHQGHAMEEQEGENNEDEYDDEDDEGEDDEDEGSAYEIVTNKQPSSVTSTT